MKKSLAALLAVASLAAFTTTSANAQRWVAPAIAGGIIGGAIVGGAIASQAPPPAYVAPGPVPCRWVRERYWDGYDWRFRRVQYCD